jgi:hypothetical protein
VPLRFLNLAACRAPAAVASGQGLEKRLVVSQAMECSRGRRRWRWCGRSMLKLAGLCFAMAIICLCGVQSWACSGSGCGCRGRSTVLLRSGNKSRKAFSLLCRCLPHFGNFFFGGVLYGDLLCRVIGDTFLIHGSCSFTSCFVLMMCSLCSLCTQLPALV